MAKTKAKSSIHKKTKSIPVIPVRAKNCELDCRIYFPLICSTSRQVEIEPVRRELFQEKRDNISTSQHPLVLTLQHPDL